MKTYFYNTVLGVLHKTVQDHVETYHNAGRNNEREPGMWWKRLSNFAQRTGDADFTDVAFHEGDGQTDKKWDYYRHVAKNGDEIVIGYLISKPLSMSEIGELIVSKGWLDNLDGKPDGFCPNSTLPTPRRLSLHES